jgi:sugar lactone lactonase YvrE
MNKSLVSSVFCMFWLVCSLLTLNDPISPVAEKSVTRPCSSPRPSFPQGVGTLSGTVASVGGTPLEGFWVGAGDYDTVAACGGGAYGVWSGPDGAYQIDVSPGTYLVYVNSHDAPGSYLPEAYRDVNSWSAIDQAARVTVADGQSVSGIDFSLPTGFSLSGRLVDAGGEPVLGAGGSIQNLSQTVEYGCALGFGSSDSDGSFRVNVPAGTYDLGFGTPTERHMVQYGLVVTGTMDLGDVLFADAPRPVGPRALEPGYTAEWFVAPGAFNMPQEILLTPGGDLWVLAVRSDTLYRLTSTGVITPVVSGTGAYVGDMDSEGNAYLYGQPGGEIHRVAPDGTRTLVVQSSEIQAACDSGFGIGPDGNLYVAWCPCDGSKLIRITPGGTITHLSGETLPTISALRTAPDGRFLAAGNDRLYELSLSDYSLTQVGQIPTSGIAPSGLAVDGAGNIYLSTGARQYGGELYRIAPNGQTTLLANIPLNGLSGIEWLPDTQEVVGAQLRQGAVLAVGPAGAIRELVPGNGLVTPMGMAFAPDGALAVANDDGGMMARVDPSGRVAWFFDYISFAPPMPFVAYAPGGTLYASEGAPGNVGRIVRLSPGATTPGPWIDVDWPSGLARERSGAWLVSDTLAGRITRVNPDLSTTTVAEGLRFPQALAFEDGGRLYAVVGPRDFEPDQIFVVPTMGDAVVEIAPGGEVVTKTQADGTAALAVAPGGDLFAATGSHVTRIAPDGTATAFADGFRQAMGLAFDLAGDLYVSDAEGNGIARIRGFPQGTVQGEVRAASGTPLAGAELRLLCDWPIVVGGVVTTTADGSFQVSVAPRTYTCTASAESHWPQSELITVTAGITKTLTFALDPQCKVFLPLILREN